MEIIIEKGCGLDVHKGAVVAWDEENGVRSLSVTFDWVGFYCQE